MLLKRIEMQGFKSFADKTVLSFVDGATAVVGPNGSGKSNISDAIRWVIGEMSAKSLRGSNMQDVIFSGTQTRKPVNYAEVSLVLDNSAHTFNIEFDEVIVTRRLFRSGESIYQINRANCRLKDIHELFMDTGLGRDGYSIIGQGNVSQILSTKAEDRRSIFEEAAGVSKYKYRKEEAIRKLTGVEENLVRIGDITLELENQVGPLKRQSEKARKYVELYTEYKVLDVNMSLVNLEKNKAVFEETQKLYNSVEEELNMARNNEKETGDKFEALQQESREKDEEKNTQNELLRENAEKAMEIKKDISITQNNIKNNNDMIGRIEAEIGEITAKNQQRKEQIESFKLEIKEKEAQAEEILKNFDQMQGESDNTTQKRDELQSQIEEKRASLIKYQNDAAALNEKISGAGKLRESYLQRRDEIELEIKQFGLNKETTEQEIEENEKNISIKQEKLSKLKLTTNSKQEDAQRIDNELSKINTELNTQKVEYNSKTSKKKILEGMENDYEGYSRSVKAVLKAPELKRLCVYGTVSGLIEVKKDYVVAIETALGGSMQNIVVESEEDAKEAIAYLRNNNSGRATFLPITSVKGKALENANEILKENGVIGLASKLISYDKKYDGVIASLLGRVVVVDNIDNAIALSRKYGYKFRVVTIEGDILNSGGSMSGGSVNKQSGFLSRAAQIKELGADIVSLSASLRALTQKQEEFIKEKELVNTQLEAYIPMVREYEDEILKLENACVYLRQSIENDDKNRDASNSEQKKIEELLKASSEESAILLSSLRSAKNNAIEAEGSIKQLEDELKRISELKEEQSGKLMDETVRLGALQKDVEFIKSQIEALNEEIISQSEALTLKQGDIEEIKNTVTIMEKTIEEKRLLWEETQRNGEELLSVIENIDAQKEVIASKLKQIQDSNKTLTDKLLNLQQELSRIENKRVKLEMEQESIVNRLWDDYELTITSAQEERIEVEDVKAANERLYELKSAIKALGNVNVDSIEEYKAVKERYEFLSEQKKDLEKSKENLTEIIASMEELIEDHFEEQFNEINKSFSEIFSELFGGGRGRLYLSDPDNVLESGIEIEVQLPGKGLQNLNLYSGGEKSFIAIALLFAILKVKPTPFCILDEIDAALDDVNVSRFATYLKNYTENTQFIVITHRRGTMEAANILYGVTMQEKGVSKLLSLLIDDVDEKLIK